MKTTISLPAQTYNLVLTKAKQLGLSVTDYVRHLVITVVKEKTEELPMVDEETNKKIGESLKAYKEGRYIIVDTSNEKELNKALGIQ